MRLASLELMVALGVTALAVVGLLSAINFPGASAYLPVVVLGFAALLGVIWAAQSAWSLRKAGRTVSLVRAELTRLGIIMSAALALAFTMPTLGFFTSFAVILPATAWLLGYREWRGLTLGTVLFLVPVYLLFVVLLDRPLPAEIWQQLLG